MNCKPSPAHRLVVVLVMAVWWTHSPLPSATAIPFQVRSILSTHRAHTHPSFPSATPRPALLAHLLALDLLERQRRSLPRHHPPHRQPLVVHALDDLQGQQEGMRGHEEGAKGGVERRGWPGLSQRWVGTRWGQAGEQKGPRRQEGSWHGPRTSHTCVLPALLPVPTQPPGAPRA